MLVYPQTHIAAFNGATARYWSLPLIARQVSITGGAPVTVIANTFTTYDAAGSAEHLDPGTGRQRRLPHPPRPAPDEPE